MHLSAPAQQGSRGSQFRTSAEHGDVQITKIEPVRIVEYEVHGLGDAWFGDAVIDPVGELASKVGVEQATTLVHEGEFGLARDRASYGHRADVVLSKCCHRLAQ